MTGKSAGAAAAQQIAQSLDEARARLSQGKLREAERICRAVIAQRPAHFAALDLLGLVMTAANHNEEAVRLFQSAAAINPTSPLAYLHQGIALASLGRHIAALACFDRIIARDPRHTAALVNRGVALRAMGRHQEALDSYDRAQAITPGHPTILINRAGVLCAMLRYEEALTCCDEVLRLHPDNTEVLLNRGVALLGLHRNEEALATFERALLATPNNATLCNGRGNALLELGRLEEAAASFKRALALETDNAKVLVNLGNTLRYLGRNDEALASFERAETLIPDFAEAHFAESLCRLSLGDFALGWRKYEWRWQQPTVLGSQSDRARPLWLGATDVIGKTILLHAEQGFGDTLQFCRYAPLVARTADVVLEVPRPLLRLLSTLPGVSRIVASGDPLPHFDLHCPLLSLPLAFGTTLADLPNHVPYLRADPVHVTAWRQRLAPLPGIRVGLVWSGNPRLDIPLANRIDRRRSTTLDRLAPLGEIPGVSLVSLQKGDFRAQSTTPPPGLAIADWTDELDDFADTAALIEALDLVISVDTSVVHLAGALGKPVWVLNRYDACWRWLRDRGDSPWYPTARLFRQPTPGDWDGMIAEVVAALRHWQPHAR